MSHKETLTGMRCDIGLHYFGLVIFVSGGGVAENFPLNMDTKDVANKLRRLADRLDRNVEARAPEQLQSKRATVEAEFERFKNQGISQLKKDMGP